MGSIQIIEGSRGGRNENTGQGIITIAYAYLRSRPVSTRLRHTGTSASSGISTISNTNTSPQTNTITNNYRYRRGESNRCATNRRHQNPGYSQ